MIDELQVYKNNDHFFFTKEADMKKVCNAPAKGMGVYVVYELKNGRIRIVYIGAAGRLKNNGIKETGNGFLNEFLDGIHFGGSREKTWKEKLASENIEALDIYWFETFNEIVQDLPAMVQGQVLQEYYDLHGNLPEWNEIY